MIYLLALTLFVLLLYGSYPLVLRCFPALHVKQPDDTDKELSVTLVLITCNGISFLEEKIRQLHEEVKQIRLHEFIVIDDHSSDGTRELLESLKEPYHLNLVLKPIRKGIPHTMNLAAKVARFDILVFCDQRQKLGPGALAEILRPLHDERIGAVSGSITGRDTRNRWSMLRVHENVIKEAESRIGSLIGVYGPFFAVRKACYRTIPEQVILDDLCLSLMILSQKNIVLAPQCRIIEENFVRLYNFSRSKRYLLGFMQILSGKEFMSNLTLRIKIMLLWHKYLRLLIPPLLLSCYVSSLFMALSDALALVVFLGISFLILFSIVCHDMRKLSDIQAFFRINLFYAYWMVSFALEQLFRLIRTPNGLKKA